MDSKGLLCQSVAEALCCSVREVRRRQGEIVGGLVWHALDTPGSATLLVSIDPA